MKEVKIKLLLTDNSTDDEVNDILNHINEHLHLYSWLKEEERFEKEEERKIATQKAIKKFIALSQYNKHFK
jgi:hypothetical protein